MPGLVVVLVCISIHALREEGDGHFYAHNRYYTHFYPRPPRGGRHPHRRQCHRRRNISIHALREEGDTS